VSARRPAHHLVRCRLKLALQAGIEAAREAYPKARTGIKEKKHRDEYMYGSLNAIQRMKYDALLGGPFVPRVHSKAVGRKLLEQFKCNFTAKALVYIEIAFSTRKYPVKLLEKARDCIDEFNTLVLPPESPFLDTNETQIGLVFNYNMLNMKMVAIFRKENIRSSGIADSNTALEGTGRKMDQTGLFMISRLKSNCLYSWDLGHFVHF
jgi:hypothetical protein